jgi:hypothetical protein
MRSSARKAVWFGLAAALVAGCQAPRTATETTEAGADDGLVWEETLRVLREAGFQPDRQDRVSRVIVTHPETSAQWFEFWRGDVADAYSLLESSLQTVQRKATVRVAERRGDEPLSVAVTVDVYRWSTPERQVTSASGGINLFSSRVPTTEGERLTTADESARLIKLGRDAAMEQRLAERIEQSCGAGVIASPSPADPAVSNSAAVGTTVVPF